MKTLRILAKVAVGLAYVAGSALQCAGYHKGGGYVLVVVGGLTVIGLVTAPLWAGRAGRELDAIGI